MSRIVYQFVHRSSHAACPLPLPHITPATALELLGNPLAASFIACLDRQRSAIPLQHVTCDMTFDMSIPLHPVSHCAHAPLQLWPRHFPPRVNAAGHALHCNKLQTLDPSLFAATSITSLRLDSNLISNLPDDVASSSSLQVALVCLHAVHFCLFFTISSRRRSTSRSTPCNAPPQRCVPSPPCKP